MKKIKRIMVLAILLAVGVGLVALLTMDIPAPSEQVERTLPDDDFPN